MPALEIPSLESLSVRGKRVLLRCDFNVPLKEGVITDDGRIKASLPTINYLLGNGATLIICAHLGRPNGERKPELSLAPIALRLSELLKKKVAFASDTIGSSAHSSLASLGEGEIILLENLRYENAETSKDDGERAIFAKALTASADLYVGDGFGAVHRKHASVYESAKMLPRAAGKLIAAEVRVLQNLMENPVRPYTVVLGGAKVSDKIGVISNLLNKVDHIAIGGGMLFTFLAARGLAVGLSLLERDLIPTVQDILRRAEELGVEILLPTDIAVAPAFANASPIIVSAEKIPLDQIGLDIGPDSATAFARVITSSHTVFWNGPMGVFEFSHFAAGTKVVAQALTEVDGLTVVGGGDSAAAVRALGFTDSQFGYISTGGGASLEYLEGKELPGLTALQS